MAFGSVFNLSSINGSNGFTLNSTNAGDKLGYSVSSAGDINGDGLDEVIIGSPYADPSEPNDGNAGQSYVVFGSTAPFNSTLNLSSLNGSNGFVVNGRGGYALSGCSVSNAGDVNNDGLDDLIIGAKGAFPNGISTGQAYVVFGSTTAFASSLNISSLNGSNGFAINAINSYERLGSAVSLAGDVNGDGIDDVIVGAPRSGANGVFSGQSYVVFGSTNPFTANFNLSSLNGSNGFAINGISPYDFSGNSVSNAGDVNGDGFDDLIVAASAADVNGTNSGQTYVVFGSTKPFASSLNLSSLNGSNGFAVNGLSDFDYAGGSVSSAGDVNGDGLDDLIIGAPFASVTGISTGQTCIVFGSTQPFASSLNLSSLNGSNGFAINGVGNYSYSGYAVSGAGDVNDDGFDDLIIGAIGADANGVNSGQSYVVFGSTWGFVSRLNLSSLNGSNGFALNGVNLGDLSGYSVSGAGDVNGDGISDLIIGARAADPQGIQSGQGYVIFGQVTISGIIQGDNNNNLLNGTSANNAIKGLGGNDTLNGLAGDDSLDGGTGNDSLDGGTGNDTIFGGTGNDIYVVDKIADLVRETNTITSEIDTVQASTSYTLGTNLENLTLTGITNLQGFDNNLNNLIIGNTGNNFLDAATGNDNLNGSSGNDTLNGGIGNDNLNGGSGNDNLKGGTGNDTYVVDNTNDVVQETNTSSSEIDTVQASISYTLGTNLENLTLTGSANLNGLGNSFNNLIIGNTGNNLLDGSGSNDTLNGREGNDTLNGGIGNDSLSGGIGNDTYIVDNKDDLVQETSTITTEIDTVQTNNSYTLGGNVENLILTGTNNTLGVGNSRNNSITGNNGNNTINGGAGNDTLNGGFGNDSFRFNTGAPFNITALGVDTIGDFTISSDKIVLSKTTFTAISSNVGTGFSNASEFATVTTLAQAETSTADIVYNSNSDRLFYNQNGTATGFGTGGAFAAFLSNPNLGAGDFNIIA